MGNSHSLLSKIKVHKKEDIWDKDIYGYKHFYKHVMWDCL